MHLLAEQSIDVDCPVESAFAFASDLEHFGSWFPGVIAIESANGLDPATSGKEYLETVAVPLRGRRLVRISVVHVEYGKRLVTEGAFAPLFPRMEISFEPTGASSCRVTWRMFSRNDRRLARLTVIPLARSILGKRAPLGMAALKRLLEGREKK